MIARFMSIYKPGVTITSPLLLATALYFLPMVPMLWHSAETPNSGTMAWSTQTQDGKICRVRIFDVSSSTGLGIEGYPTCWKDELGNHTLGMKAQNMYQLRVLG